MNRYFRFSDKYRNSFLFDSCITEVIELNKDFYSLKGYKVEEVTEEEYRKLENEN